jgi:hypothetical protein
MLSDLILSFLKNSNDINVYGFNKTSEEYTCKYFVKKSLLLEFKISAQKINSFSRLVKFSLIVGSSEQLNKIFEKFKNLIKLFDDK